MTAISFDGAAPVIAAKPGAEPSTNSIPRSRMITSEAAPNQMSLTGWLPFDVSRYLQASRISHAKSDAMPASSALPRYGSHTSSEGRWGSSSLVFLRTVRQSARVSTLSPENEWITGR